MRRLAFSVLAVLGTTSLVVVTSCLQPTQITLEITTDLPCVGTPDEAGVTAPAVPGVFSRNGHVDLWLGDTPGSSPQAVARSCVQDGVNYRVGTIAIVPTGSNDERVSVTVAVNARDASLSEACNVDAPSADCIVARRNIGFIPHTPLTLPIHLSLACAGVSCDKTKGETCENGVCISSRVDCPNGKCADAAVEAAPPVDAGACNGAGLGNAKNCLKCGFACDGICQPTTCQLIKTVPPTTDIAEACIAVQGPIVVFSVANLTKGSVSWSPRTGTASANVLNADVGIGAIAAAESRLSYVIRLGPPTGNSLVLDVDTTPKAISNTMQQQKGPAGTHDWVAAGKAGRCATFAGGNGNGIDCEQALWSTSTLPPRFPHLAVGKDSYLAVRAATVATDLVAGSTTNSNAAQGTNGSLKAPFVIAALENSDTYVVASPTGTGNPTTWGLWAVAVTNGGGGYSIAVPPAPFYVQADPITGLRVVGTTVYFADAKRIAKVDVTGATNQKAQPVFTPDPSTAFTLMHSRLCLDADDVALYFMLGGLPMRVPR